MADRSVVVKLRAEIGQYQAAMKQARASTTEFGREVTGQGKTAKADVEALGRGALVMGGAMALGFGKALMTAADFEKQMSGVQAVSGASAAEMAKLSDAAIAAGASTKLAGVTASDAAMAQAELVKAGVSTADVLGGALMGSLTLAAAGQIDFANAATIAAQAMNIFDLKGSQVTHVADVLAAAANKSAADVGQLGDALRQGGLVASQYGVNLEDTVGTLAMFADNALVGSDAGTALKTMLQRLSPISKESASLMEELGFSAYDSQGRFIGMAGVAQELQTSLAGLTQEQRDTTLAQLFGSDAVRGANVLYEMGAKGVREYSDAVNDQGAAARMAAIQNDNLKGDIEALGGAIESAFIENGSKATGVLRGITQAATGAVNGFSSLPSGVQSTAMGLGAVVTGGTLVIGVLGTLYPKFTQAKTALEGMGGAGQALSRNLGRIAGGMGAIGAGLAVFTAFEAVMGKAAESGREWAESLAPEAMDFDSYETLKDKLYAVEQGIGDLTSAANDANMPWDADKRKELLAGADGLGVFYDELSRLRALAMDLAPVLDVSKNAALDFVMSQQDAGVDILAADYEGLKDELTETFDQTARGTIASQQLAGNMSTLGSEVASVEEQVKAFGDSLDVLYNQFFGIEAAEDAFQTSLNELPDVLKDAADAGLDLNDVLADQSDEAIGVRGHMRGMLADASDMIAEWQEQGITGEALAGKVYLLSQSFRDQAIAAGAPIPVVDHYLSMLGAIPLTKHTQVVADTSNAMVELDRLARRLNDLPGNLRVSVGGGGGLTLASGGLVPQYLASGGGARGTDTVPAWLTPGEFVMKKSAVDRFGIDAMAAINSGFMPLGASSGGSSVNVYVNAGNIVGDHRELVRVVQRGIDEGARLTAGPR